MSKHMNLRTSQSAPVSPLSSPNPTREITPAPPHRLEHRNNFLRKHGMKILIGTVGSMLGYGLKKLGQLYTDKQNKFKSNIRKTKIH